MGLTTSERRAEERRWAKRMSACAAEWNEANPVGITNINKASAFVVEVLVEGEPYGKGSGRTKKAAEQQAAYEALLKIKDFRK